LNNKNANEIETRPKTSKLKPPKDPLELDLKKSKFSHLKSAGISPSNGKHLKLVKQAFDSKLISQQGINKKLKF
jgi:hypothetical protein